MSRPPAKPGVFDLATVFGDLPEETPAQRAERKRISTRCGHVKRRLLRKELLQGDLLEFALGTIGEPHELAEKLKAGQPLDDYELHLMLDMYLPHAR